MSAGPALGNWLLAARDERKGASARSTVCELMNSCWLQYREDIPRKRSGFDFGH